MRHTPSASAIGCTVGCLTLLLACSQEPTYDKPLTPVTVQSVERAPAKAGTRYSASISPKTQVDVAFKLAGYITDIQRVRGTDARTRILQPGDHVSKGSILARLRESDYVVKLNEAKSNEADAEANFNQAKLDFERAQNLFDSKSLTKSDYDASHARYQSAQARLQGAVESRKEAEIPVQDSKLTAPMDGVIVKRNIEVGSLVSAGTIAFVLADSMNVKVIFGVPDISVSQVHLGQEVTVTIDALPGGGFPGRITKVDPSADANSRIFQIEIEIPNREQRLKPGMIAAVTLGGTTEATDQVTVPLTAIIRTQGKDTDYALYVVDRRGDKDVALLRRVKLGPVSGNTVVVLEGVNRGESVIIKGTTLVMEGEPVRVVQGAN